MDSRLVGMLVLWMILDEAHIATVATHPDYRRQGIAKQLLVEALELRMRKVLAALFWKSVSGNEPAQEMYRKLGFEVVGRRERYYKDNFEDAILMTLPFHLTVGLSNT